MVLGYLAVACCRDSFEVVPEDMDRTDLEALDILRVDQNTNKG